LLQGVGCNKIVASVFQMSIVFIEGCATNATCRPAHKFIASLHHFTHPSRAALHALHCIACIALQSMQGFATPF